MPTIVQRGVRYVLLNMVVLVKVIISKGGVDITRTGNKNNEHNVIWLMRMIVMFDTNAKGVVAAIVVVGVLMVVGRGS